MDGRFDQEFYKSEWQRVLPLGPDGIQPYVRASRSSRSPGLGAYLHRLIPILVAVAQGVIASGRFAAIGMAKRPTLSAIALRAERQRPSDRLAHEAPRPAAPWAAAPRCRSRAA